MSNARNTRRKANRAVRSIGRMILNETTVCPCYGARDGRPSYSVRPAVCGHWFYLNDMPDGTIVTTGVLRERPITNIKRGATVPLVTDHNLSFKRKRGF